MSTDKAISFSSTETVPSTATPPVVTRTRLAGLASIGAGVGIVIGNLLTIDPNQSQTTYLATLGTHQATG